jgi:hypothetical protein
MPHPNHCIDCDKPSTVVMNNVYYCAACALKEVDKIKAEESMGDNPITLDDLEDPINTGYDKETEEDKDKETEDD